MKGAIIGDIVGSIYEFHNIKTTDFPFFDLTCFCTDDTVLTVATAKALMEFPDPENAPDSALESAFLQQYLEMGQKFPAAGYGGAFRDWLNADFPKPYYSCGNGSAMRVSPVAHVATSLESALRMARLSARVTHNHPDGMAGAEATAGAVYLARQEGTTVEDIIAFVNRYYPGTDHLPSLEQLRPQYTFDHFAGTCAGTVPFAAHCLRGADSYEQAVRQIVSLGGDTDTLAAIGGSIAEPLFGLPTQTWRSAKRYLPREFIDVVDAFYARFMGGN